MKKYILLVFVQLVCFISNAQYDCGWHGKMAAKERNAEFPFNKTKKVLLVSYANKEYETGVSGSFTVAEASKKLNKEILNKRIVTRDIENNPLTYFTLEEIELAPEAMDDLSNLLLNYKTKKNLEGGYKTAERAFCYEPRNAVLFFDENDTIIACIEICFQCRGLYVYPITDYNFYMDVAGCDEKVTLLRELFKNSGINYGITDRR